MNADVENEAKLHITNGIEKASSSTGVDIKVSLQTRTVCNDSILQKHALTLLFFLSSIASLQTGEGADG